MRICLSSSAHLRLRRLSFVGSGLSGWWHLLVQARLFRDTFDALATITTIIISEVVVTLVMI
jgi:hypothetical protein